jgi:hypothetical protein
MTVIELDEMFLRELAKKLGELPRPTGDDLRECSWMTASQIAEWSGEKSLSPTKNGADLNMALLEGWEQDSRFAALKIRPAKYPSLDMSRLWGHEDVVGARNRDEICQRRIGPRAHFEARDLSSIADDVFLSHSTLDLQFALEVRLALARRNVRAWLAQEEIEEGEPIFESVRAAILKARATVVLLGRHALGSAWVYTEVIGGGEERRMFVCEGADTALMELLASWTPPKRHGEVNFREDLLDPLEQAYRESWELTKSQEDVLNRAAGGVRVRKERPDKFRQGAIHLLFALESVQTSIYPMKPTGWKGSPIFRDFDEALDRAIPAPES